MILTNYWTYNYDLDSVLVPNSAPGKLENIGSHKLVMAYAQLTSKGDHQVGGAAAVGFTQFAQGGNITNLPVQRGAIAGPNITDLRWDLSVVQCHARASVVIMTFD
jgi:hypothetical protein